MKNEIMTAMLQRDGEIELPFDIERDELVGTAKQDLHGWDALDTALYQSNAEDPEFVGTFYAYTAQTGMLWPMPFEQAVSFADEYLGIDLTLWALGPDAMADDGTEAADPVEG